MTNSLNYFNLADGPIYPHLPSSTLIFPLIFSVYRNKSTLNKQFGDPHPQRTNMRLSQVLVTCGLALLLLAPSMLITLLALNVFTIPYLTPLAHFILLILTPIIPFLMPVSLGILIKIWRSQEAKELEKRKIWLLIVASNNYQHISRGTIKLAKLYTRAGVRPGVTGGWCALKECSGAYFEAALLIGVVVAEWWGWKWEGGVVDWAISGLCREEIEKMRAAEVGHMEKGAMEDGKIEEEYHDEKLALEEGKI